MQFLDHFVTFINHLLLKREHTVLFSIPYLLTVLLSVLFNKLPYSSYLTSSPATTTTEVSPSDSTPANDQCQENGLYYEIDTLKSTIEQANQETRGKIIKFLTPNRPRIQLWCARSK